MVMLWTRRSEWFALAAVAAHLVCLPFGWLYLYEGGSAPLALHVAGESRTGLSTRHSGDSSHVTGLTALQVKAEYARETKAFLERGLGRYQNCAFIVAILLALTLVAQWLEVGPSGRRRCELGFLIVLLLLQVCSLREMSSLRTPHRELVDAVMEGAPLTKIALIQTAVATRLVRLLLVGQTMLFGLVCYLWLGAKRDNR